MNDKITYFQRVISQELSQSLLMLGAIGALRQFDLFPTKWVRQIKTALNSNLNFAGYIWTTLAKKISVWNRIFSKT